MHAATLETSDEPKIKAGDPAKRIPAIIKLLMRGNIRLAHTLSTDSRRRNDTNEQVRLLNELTTFMSGNTKTPSLWIPSVAELIQRKSVESCEQLENYFFGEGRLEESEFCALIYQYLVEDTEAPVS